MTNAVNGMNGRKKAVSGFLMTMDGKSLSRRNDSEMYEIEPGCKTTTYTSHTEQEEASAEAMTWKCEPQKP